MTETPPAPPPEPAKDTRSPPPPGGANPIWLWLALALVGGLAAWPLLQPKGSDEARFSALEGRIEALPPPATEALAGGMRALAERIAKLESAGASKDALGKIEESQDALALQNKALTERLAKGAADGEAAIRHLTETLDRLERRVVIAEAKIEAGTGAPAALALGLGQLRQALARSGPFAEELERFRQVAKDEAALRAATDALAAWAREGAASLDELRGRFAEVARNAVRLTARGADGLWGEIVDRIASLVVVRRVGEVAGETAEALIARAEARLAAGDLAAAAALVERLSGEAARVAGDWLAAAKVRLEVERALGELDARVGERLGKAAGHP